MKIRELYRIFQIIYDLFIKHWIAFLAKSQLIKRWVAKVSATSKEVNLNDSPKTNDGAIGSAGVFCGGFP
jgi:hypothetical protein